MLKLLTISGTWKFAIALFLIFTGCAVHDIMLDHAVIRNETPGVISDVQVVHEPTGKTGAVNMILPQRSFELGFAGQPLRAKRAIITWNDHEGQGRRSEADLPAPPAISPNGQYYSLIYSIHPAGVVRVQLVTSDKN